MSENRQEKWDTLDLLIGVLMEHEKNLDNLINELTIIASNLKILVEKLDSRNETIKRFHEPITM